MSELLDWFGQEFVLGSVAHICQRTCLFASLSFCSLLSVDAWRIIEIQKGRYICIYKIGSKRYRTNVIASLADPWNTLYFRPQMYFFIGLINLYSACIKWQLIRLVNPIWRVQNVLYNPLWVSCFWKQQDLCICQFLLVSCRATCHCATLTRSMFYVMDYLPAELRAIFLPSVGFWLKLFSRNVTTCFVIWAAGGVQCHFYYLNVYIFIKLFTAVDL